MTDQAPVQVRRGDSGDKLTANSLTAAGAGAFLLWIFGMIDCGKFFVPPVETAMFMGASILPIMQAVGKRWIREINKPDIGGGVNGQPKAEKTKSDPAGIAAGAPTS